MKALNVISIACLCLGLALSACVPTSTNGPPPAVQSEATAVIPVTPLSGAYVVAADVAVARTSPSLEAAILVTYEAGDVVQVSGLSGAETWFRVETDKGEGWVAATFLTEQLETPAEPATATRSSETVEAEVSSPTPTSCGGAPPGWVRYRVSAGDTLANLAAATGTTTTALRQANCILPSDSVIKAGQWFWVPRLPPPTAAPPDTPTATATIIIPTPTATVTATPPFQPPPRVQPTETRRAEP